MGHSTYALRTIQNIHVIVYEKEVVLMPGNKYITRQSSRDRTSTREEEYRDLALAKQPLKPLRELLGLVSPSSPSPKHSEHLFYDVVNTSVWPGPSMRKERRKWRRRKDKKIPSGGNGDKVPVEICRTTPNMPRITTDNLQTQTSPSSSIFSSSIQNNVPPSPSILSEDIIPPTQPQDNAYPSLTRVTHSPVQPNDISSCSEVEAFLGASQQQPARKRARKRRRIASKLSLSQSSHRQEQSSLASDNVQILTEVLHIPSSGSSSSNTSSSSTSTSSHHTNAGTSRNPDLSTRSNISMEEESLESQNLLAPNEARAVHQPAQPPSSSSGSNINSNSIHTTTDTNRIPDRSKRQEASFESQNLLAPVVARGMQHSAKHTKQSEAMHTLGQRQAWLLQQNLKTRAVKAIHGVATHRQHTRSKTCASQGRRVTFQSPITPITHVSGCYEPDSHARPQVLSTECQEDVTLTSTSDSDQSVYYEATSQLTMLDESHAALPGIKKNPPLPTGQILLPVTQQGDADTSSSSSQRESDYTSHSCSSTSSSSCVVESLLNRTVIMNKQVSCTFKRPVGEAFKERGHPAGQRQIRRHEPQLGRHQDKWQLNSQPRTSSKDTVTSGWSQKQRQRQDQKEKWPYKGIKNLQQAMEAEVSSSTSEPQSEDELSGQKMQEAKRPQPMKAASRLEASAVSSSCSSSSSSSSSSVLLTKEGMGCIQTIGEVFKHYFGGTVEDNLSVIRRNNFNLLQSLMELQAAPHLSHHTQSHHPS